MTRGAGAGAPSDGAIPRAGKTPVKTVTSAGGVVVRADHGSACLILWRRHEKEAGGAGERVAFLPKGLVEEGETPQAAALREVHEEGGVVAQIVRELPTIDYWFYWRPEKTRYHKFVHFFLMRYVSGDVADHDFEVESAEWVPLEHAPDVLTYDSERDTVRAAID